LIENIQDKVYYINAKLNIGIGIIQICQARSLKPRDQSFVSSCLILFLQVYASRTKMTFEICQVRTENMNNIITEKQIINVYFYDWSSLH
jgi:hypothetical protein